MKITAIIPARNELPENVARTTAAIQSQGVNALVVEDTDGLGPGLMRHRGLLAAGTEAVLFCDAHMEFSPGYFDGVLAHLDANPADVTVSRMQSIGHDWQPLEDKTYCAAQIQTCTIEPGNQHIPLSPKWRRADTGPGPVGCLMGACYGMLRDRYRDMGMPASFLRAWGCEEEAISIACWLTGGRVYLIGGLARHMYAAPHPGRCLPRDEVARIWSNRIALLCAIPMPDERRKELVDWARRTATVQNLRAEINHHVAAVMPDAERMYTACAAGPMTWEEYERDLCNQQPGVTPEEAARVERMRKADAARYAPTTAQTPASPTPAPAGPPGPACPHCGSRHGHRVCHTFPNWRRRFFCGKCGGAFIESAKGG
jgi:hypothetical protein